MTGRVSSPHECPEPCDDDCQAVCHAAHQVEWKRDDVCRRYLASVGRVSS